MPAAPTIATCWSRSCPASCRQLATEEAIARLEQAGIATARVSDMAALWEHPQLKARDRWREFGSPAGPLPGLKPVSGDGWQPRFDPVPALGEHTEAILAEFNVARAGRDQERP